MFCPFRSTSKEKVPCETDCALRTSYGGKDACALFVETHYIELIAKKLGAK